MSSEIYETVAPNATLENLAGDIGEDIGGGLGDAIAEFPTTGNEKSEPPGRSIR